MSLVRVSEVDGLVYELPWASNKSLAPITFCGHSFLSSNQAIRVRFAPIPAGRVGPDSGVV